VVSSSAASCANAGADPPKAIIAATAIAAVIRVSTIINRTFRVI
jgi:hypothetical protein